MSDKVGVQNLVRALLFWRRQRPPSSPKEFSYALLTPPVVH